jgi:hypothetical protein
VDQERARTKEGMSAPTVRWTATRATRVAVVASTGTIGNIVVDLVTLTDDRELIARLTTCYDTPPLRSSWRRVANGAADPG